MKFKIVEIAKEERQIKTKGQFDAGKVIQYINTNCQPFLKMMAKEGIKRPLYRGINADYGHEVMIKKVRKNRRPTDTDTRLHNLLSAAFTSVFGWSARSQGVFATGHDHDAYSYGKVYAIFPIGNFKFIYSKNIGDLFSKYDAELSKIFTLTDNKFLSKEWKKAKRRDWDNDDSMTPYLSVLRKYPIILKAFVKKYYTNKDLAKAIKSGSEISILCNKYVAVMVMGEDDNNIEEQWYKQIIKGTIGR
jgi:hypothetical protein